MGRPAYDELPAGVRAWADHELGSPVVAWRSEPGGFSPGVASRLTCADGTRAFVKAVSAEVNPVTPQMHRTEARVTAALPRGLGSPRLLASYDDGTWVALLLEQVDGRPPARGALAARRADGGAAHAGSAEPGARTARAADSAGGVGR